MMVTLVKLWLNGWTLCIKNVKTVHSVSLKWNALKCQCNLLTKTFFFSAQFREINVLGFKNTMLYLNSPSALFNKTWRQAIICTKREGVSGQSGLFVWKITISICSYSEVYFILKKQWDVQCSFYVWYDHIEALSLQEKGK